MTDTGTPLPTDLPCPALALQRRFSHILAHAMQGVPMVNPALGVRAVGFRPWGAHWLGVLVTPWFMNLVLLPRVATQWHPIPERESRHFVFPAGVFEFIGAVDAELGDHLACSLFSPMFDFDDMDSACATAAAALEALFDATHSGAGAHAAAPAAALAPPAAPPVVSKRAFLFGSTPEAGHGPGR